MYLFFSTSSVPKYTWTYSFVQVKHVYVWLNSIEKYMNINYIYYENMFYGESKELNIML